jgi:hypothetical protein
MFPSHGAASLFADQRQDATNEEVVAAFRVAIQGGGRLPRLADLYLSTVCAKHLVDELRGTGLDVVRRPKRPLRW